jgi:D-amino-acid dehydrogenase
LGLATAVTALNLDMSFQHADPAHTPPALGPDDGACEVLVIGAGIVGLSIALRLREHGHQVLVIDRQGIAAEASRGNAGAYAFSDILPLASPGILRQAPRWLLDPLGPLSLRPAYLPTLLPWLWQFWRASQPSRVVASTAAQAALLRLSAQTTPGFLKSARASHMLRSNGNLHLYETQAQWQRAQAGWQVRAQHGIEFQHLHGVAAIAKLQPGLSPSLTAATLVPGWQSIADPLLLTQTIAATFEALGGQIRQAHATSLQPGPDGMQVMVQDAPACVAQKVVVAAGAWSHQLAKSLGDQLPLETERGYNTTLPAGAFELCRQLTFPEHGFVVTPIGGGSDDTGSTRSRVRVGGAVELAGLNAAPNYARADVLLAKARGFLPALKTEGGVQWMGFRPSLPDSLPVIGPAPADGRVIYAFGHGHLGLTQSAATADLVLSLVQKKSPAMDLQAFRADRF